VTGKLAEARRFVGKFPPNERERQREREREREKKKKKKKKKNRFPRGSARDRIIRERARRSQSGRQPATSALLSINGDINGNVNVH